MPMELLHVHLDRLLCLVVPHAERSQGGHGEKGSIEQRPGHLAFTADKLFSHKDSEVLRQGNVVILGEEQVVLALIAPIL